tara:strand:+ start:1891 stop:2949 length:1059 start_codon:yes stop_codon:yes gene_type:complete
MGDLFKDILKENESLFLDEVSLDFDYVPKEIPYREQSQKYVAECIKPLFQNRSGRNLFISGSPGIGKTLAIKHVLRELELETDEIIPIYINCWKKDTSFKIISEICEQIGYKWTINKRTDELLRAATNILNKKSVVLCLDEVDKVKEIDILYNLLEEILKKTIILITNNKEWLANLDHRIRSRLTPELIEFKPYNQEETSGILKTRRDFAFVPNVFQEEAFNLIVEKTAQLKDMRSGLFLLRESGNQAEMRASKKIIKEHSEKALQKLESFKIKSSADFDEPTQLILNLVKKHQGMTIKELYDSYIAENGDLAFSTFHKKIQDLKKNKMIELEQGSGPNPGKIHYHKKLADF